MAENEFNYHLIGLEKGLKSFAYKLTANSTDASDLMQETYLKALMYREQFESHTNLKSWIFTIMKNTFINNYRRSIRENTAFDNTKDLYWLNHSKVSPVAAPDSEVFEGEIWKHIEKLDDEYRIPFKMHLEGFKYQEISDHLGINIGTVKSRIYTVRQKLMKELS
ncbi:MAG: RNA polymerase sigma factor [Bacteroidales bacterium]|nr:RNA polymerase sigma factor [Bacteroidales bacterium]